jgi:hypothetical protein
MSCFDVKILDPTINTIEIETCIGDQPSSIDIVTYDNISTVEINHCVALLPSEINDLIKVKDIIAGSGIDVNSNSGIYQISLLNPVISSTNISDFLEAVQDVIGNSGLLAGNYININYNDNTGYTTISATGLQPSGNYSLVGHTHSISDVSGLQTALDGKQPSGNYAPLIHNHISTDIIDFNSAVSGLLPVKNISAGSGIGVSSSSGNFIISVTGTFGLTGEQVDDRVSQLLVAGPYINLNYNDNLDTLTITATGLQPSGNYSVVGHTHTSSNITDFNISVSGLLPSVSGSGYATTLFANNVYTVSVTGLQPSGNYANAIHSHVVNDITNFNSGVSGLLPSVSGSGYVTTVFSNNVYTISVSGLQPSGTYASGLHTHTSNDITDFNSAVSGLIPIQNIVGVSGIQVSTSGTTRQISTNLLPGNGIDLIYNNDESLTINTLTNHGIIYINDNISTNIIIPSGYIIGALSLYQNGVKLLDNIDYVAINGSGIILTNPPTSGSYIEYVSPGISANQQNGNYANVIHYHTSSDITDFNSSVSGLIVGSGNYFPIFNASGSGLTTSIMNQNIDSVGIGTTDPSGTLHIVNDDIALYVGDYSIWTQGGKVRVFVDDNDSQAQAIKAFTSRSSSGIHYGINGTSYTINGNGSGTNVGLYGYAGNGQKNWGLLIDAGQGIFKDKVGIKTLDPLYDLDVVGSGNFSNNLYVNNIAVSVSGHNHNSTNIIDFNSSVSGLLPSVSGSGYATTSFANNVYTVSVTGLQPSGNYSVVGHTHTSSNITDFNNSVSGLLPVKNVLGSGYVNVSSNSGNYTVSVTGLQPSGNYSTVGHNHTTADITDISTIYDTSIYSLGTISGTVPINYGTDRMIQKFNIDTDPLTLITGSGWPISNISRDVLLIMNCINSTSITWDIVADNWYNQPVTTLPSGEYMILLRAMGSGIIQGHYIGAKQGSL